MRPEHDATVELGNPGLASTCRRRGGGLVYTGGRDSVKLRPTTAESTSTLRCEPARNDSWTPSRTTISLVGGLPPSPQEFDGVEGQGSSTAIQLNGLIGPALSAGEEMNGWETARLSRNSARAQVTSCAASVVCLLGRGRSGQVR